MALAVALRFLLFFAVLIPPDAHPLVLLPLLLLLLLLQLLLLLVVSLRTSGSLLMSLSASLEVSWISLDLLGAFGNDLETLGLVDTVGALGISAEEMHWVLEGYCVQSRHLGIDLRRLGHSGSSESLLEDFETLQSRNSGCSTGAAKEQQRSSGGIRGAAMGGKGSSRGSTKGATRGAAEEQQEEQREQQRSRWDHRKSSKGEPQRSSKRSNGEQHGSRREAAGVSGGSAGGIKGLSEEQQEDQERQQEQQEEQQEDQPRRSRGA